MASLCSLPNELLHMILSYLPKLRDIATIASQCRHLRNLIDMPNRIRFYKIHLGADGDVPNAWPLLLKLLRYPHLGSFIKIVDISLPYGQYPRWNCKHHDGIINSEEEQLLETSVTQAGFQGEKAHRMMEILQKGRWVDADNPEYSWAQEK
jgi:F-box-like